MTTREKVLTYADYLKAPEEMKRYEIIDGVVCDMSPGPNASHQQILGDLFVLLYNFVRKNRLGRVFLAPLDIVVRTEPLRTRQPDLMFISTKRFVIIHDRVHGGPDLVIEILSPGNTKRHVEGKLGDYVQLGITECWMISPKAQTVEILELAGSTYRRRALYGAGETLESGVLPGLKLPVRSIFTSE